jgi:hypothetical protein
VESLEALQRAAYLKINYVHDSSKPFSSVTMIAFGIEMYARNYVPLYVHLRKDVVHQVLNLGQDSSAAIARALDQPILLINHIVDNLESERAFKTIKIHTASYDRHIYQISPLLKRELE